MFWSKKINVPKFVRQYADNSKRNNAYKRVYRNIANKLGAFEFILNKKIDSNDFGEELCGKFVDFLKAQGLRKNTIKNILDKTKFMFRLMSKRGYVVDWTFEDVSESKEQVSSVYLTENEIERLYKLSDLSDENRLIVDLFVVGCYTGLRFSDYSKLTTDNVSGNFIFRKTQKTGEKVQIPMHYLVKEIVARYGGFPEYKNSQQNFNKRLKNLCKEAKIDTDILVEYTKGGKVVREIVPKYNLVCTHTARRSFATNAYLAGIPTFRIMLITGHRSEDSFFKYVRIEKEENAEILLNHNFFNNKPQ